MCSCSAQLHSRAARAVQVRTSYGMFIPRYQDEVIARVQERVASWLGLPVSFQEDMQVRPLCLSALSASLPLCLSASLPLCLSASLPLCLSASLPLVPTCSPTCRSALSASLPLCLSFPPAVPHAPVPTCLSVSLPLPLCLSTSRFLLQSCSCAYAPLSCDSSDVSLSCSEAQASSCQ